MPGKFAHSERQINVHVRCQRDDIWPVVSHSANMGESSKLFGGNLRSARKARGWSLEKFAAEADTSKGYLSDLERGIRPIPPGATLEVFARTLGVSPGHLVGSSSIRAVPIISQVAAGRLTDPTSHIEGEHQTIEISGLPPGDYFATRVNGDSMDRLSPPGSLILVDRADRELIRGRRYIFARRGDTTFKRFESDPIRLEPESTNPSNQAIFPKSEEEWTVIGRVRLTLLDDL